MSNGRTRTARTTSGTQITTRIRAVMLMAALLLAMPTFLPRQALAQTAYVAYNAHVQSIGWQGWLRDGATAGTTGRAKRVEALKIKVNGAGVQGGIAYSVQGQSYGWQAEKSNGALAGTTGKAKRVEAIKIWLTGKLAESYDVTYRTHVQSIGWTKWVKNGAVSGTVGKAKRVEAIQIKLVSRYKPSTLPGYVNCVTYVQSKGWLTWKPDGATSGTIGESKRVEALRIALNNDTLGVSGGIRYRVNGQGYGWQSWKSNGSIAGTAGQDGRVEAVEVQLTGEVARVYDVWYRAHIQRGGWLGWAVNGATAGSLGYNLRLEALEVVLVPKGERGPGSTAGSLYAPVSGTPIMGTSKATMAMVIKHYKQRTTYPNYYTKKGAATLEQFVRILFEEAKAEGVRADVVYAQAMLETNYLHFGGDVLPSQCNFAGIGATGGGVRGHTFSNVRMGLRAQVQHLKAYASDKPLANPCVDPRFDLVTRGVAPTVEALSERWAAGSTYGRDVAAIINAVDSMG